VVDLPVIDVAPALAAGDPKSIAEKVDRGCRDLGFFIVTGHDIDPQAFTRLDGLAREFFALADAEKAEITMALGGNAWRGWFPLGGELTSGVPDQKEGIYFGAERPPDPRPLHGPNLFPARPAGLRDTVLQWMRDMTDLGQFLLRGIALGLGLDADWFGRELTTDPVVLFRIFRYPPTVGDTWGVAEHTDYGLLTILAQDPSGGLEVHTSEGWTAVPAIDGALVCNLGDMLERMTMGRYRSTPHRVRNTGDTDRLSFPFFLDPSWGADVRALPLGDIPADAARRWDGTSVHEFSGTYGEYITKRVAKVFPALADGLDH